MDGFEWDARRAAINRRKHGIDFADATAVFEDERAGRDTMGRVLVVAYKWRGERIRLISARRATANERSQYWRSEV